MNGLPSLNETEVKDILDGMVEGVITINQYGIILSFNKSAESMFGYTTQEAIGQNVSMLMPTPDRDHHDDYLERYVGTEEAHIIGIGRNVTALKKSGETFPMRLSVIEYPAKIEGERWFIGSCLDITLQKQQEEQIKRTLKMDALGKLVSGISHDYNNMLGVILGFSDLLTELYQDDPTLLEYLKEITCAAKRGSELTDKLLSFSRKRPLTQDIVNINEVLNDDYNMLAKAITAHIKVNINPTDGLWPIEVCKGSLEDAILNMSINAMHAMPEGGTLDIGTSNVQLSMVDAQVLNLSKGDYIKMTIADTGVGMTKEIASQIFEPFFTTKGEKGTGLGLSQVYSFVTSAGGTIRVYSEPGHGTTFSLYIPRYHTVPNKVKDEEELQLRHNNHDNASKTILVVDDEPAILDVIEKILTTNGYQVVCACSAKQALSILEDSTVDLVLSDVIMPDIDGFELAHLLRYTQPDIKIQLCSGFYEAEGKTVTDETLQKELLHKPFTANVLLERLDVLLHS